MKNVLIYLSVIFISNTVLARNIRIQNFQTSQNTTYIGVEDAFLSDQPFSGTTAGRIYFYGDYSLVREPWIDLDDTGSNYLATLISKAQVVNLGIGYLYQDHLQFGFELPVESVTTEKYPAVNSALDGGSSTGLGDARLFAKWRFYQSDSWAMALQPTLFLPTGMRTINGYSATSASTVQTGIGSSWGSLGAGLQVNIEKKWNSVLAALNLGIDYHPNSLLDGRGSVFFVTPEYTKVDLSLLYIAQLGIFIPLSDAWSLNLESGGKFSGKHNEYTQAGESYAGLRYQWNKYISVHAGYGGSLGIKNGTGERYVAGIKMPFFMPGQEPPKPVQVLPAPVKKVRYTGKKIEVDQSVEFDSGKDTLTEAGKQVLDEVAQVLLENQQSYKKVTAEGHTDYQGSAKLNQNLSERRAKTVKEYLITKGLDRTRLASKGHGETQPLFPGEDISLEQMHKNRRVEFIIQTEP